MKSLTKAKRAARKSTVNGPLVRVPDLSNIAEAMEVIKIINTDIFSQFLEIFICKF